MECSKRCETGSFVHDALQTGNDLMVDAHHPERGLEVLIGGGHAGTDAIVVGTEDDERFGESIIGQRGIDVRRHRTGIDQTGMRDDRSDDVPRPGLQLRQMTWPYR